LKLRCVQNRKCSDGSTYNGQTFIQLLTDKDSSHGKYGRGTQPITLLFGASATNLRRRRGRPSPSIFEDAVELLGSCYWNLDDAISLYLSNAGGSTKPPSDSPADPIFAEEDMSTEEDKNKDHGDAIHGDREGDAGAPRYYGSRSTAVENPCVVGAPPSAVATGWGGADPDGVREGETEATGWGAEPGDIVATGWGEAESAREGEIGATGWGTEPDGARDDGSTADWQWQEDGEYNGEYYDNNTGYGDGSSNWQEHEHGEYNDDEHYDNTGYGDGSTTDWEEHGAYNDEDYDNTGYGEDEEVEAYYPPPYELRYVGYFHGAKVHAAREDRFLLVNLQTCSGAGELPSQMQNRDLWADETVRGVIQDSFVFSLEKGGMSRGSYSLPDECEKVAAFYRLEEDQLPALLVIDPITGQLLAKWSGAMMPDEFMLFVDEYIRSKPSTLSKPKIVRETAVLPASVGAGGEQEPARAPSAAAVEQEPAPPESPAPAADGAGEQEQEISKNDSAAAGGACSEQEHAPVPNATELPAELVDDDDDEPMEGEEMYKLRIRFPSGTVVAKEFGCKRRIASLFAFCRSALRGGGQHVEEKAIRIMRFAGPGYSWEAIQDKDDGATFEDLGLNFTTVSVVFDV
jgi:hypothetical protein